MKKADELAKHQFHFNMPHHQSMAVIGISKLLFNKTPPNSTGYVLIYQIIAFQTDSCFTFKLRTWSPPYIKSINGNIQIFENYYLLFPISNVNRRIKTIPDVIAENYSKETKTRWRIINVNINCEVISHWCTLYTNT